MTLLDALFVVASLGLLWGSALAYSERDTWRLQPSAPLAIASVAVSIAGIGLAAAAISDPLQPIPSPNAWLHQWSPGLLALALATAFAWVPIHLFPSTPAAPTPPPPPVVPPPLERRRALKAILSTVDRAPDVGSLGEIARIFLRDFHDIEGADQRTSAELVRATEARLGTEAAATIEAFLETVDRAMFGGGRASPTRLSEDLRQFIRKNARRDLASPPSER